MTKRILSKQVRTLLFVLGPLLAIAAVVSVISVAMNRLRGNETFSVFGIVVDHDSGAQISRAEVKFRLYTQARFSTPGFGGGKKMTEHTVVTDETGKFAFRDLNGTIFELVDVKRDGFTLDGTPTRDAEGGVTFGVGYSRHADHLTPNNQTAPVIITMRRVN